MNYTNYNKIKKLNFFDKKKLREELNNELNIIDKKLQNSFWGKTDSIKEYIKYLKILRFINKLFFRKLFINKIIKRIDHKFDKKIRVLFLVNEYSVFPSVKSVYDTMLNNNNFICDLVYIPFFHVNKSDDIQKEINDYKNNGYKEIINCKDYNILKSSPDIVVYLKPYDSIPKEYYIYELSKIINYVIYIPYGLNAVSDEEIYKYAFQLPIQNNAWINISQSKKNQEIATKYSAQKGRNFLMIGHPRMDLMKEDYSSDLLYKKILKRAKGRKIFLYNPHHTVSEEYKWGTFKLYGLKILQYFRDNKDVFLLYRPHPLFASALNTEYKDDINFMKEYSKLLKSENIFHDDSQNYLISMHISNFLISDANSFIPEFTMYNKPVIYTMYPKNKKINDKDLESMIYIAKNIQDIIKYIEDLKIGKDDLKENRDKKISNYFIYNPKITVAEKLIKYIEKEFVK